MVPIFIAFWLMMPSVMHAPLTITPPREPMLPQRSSVPKEDTWNIEAFYPTEEQWETAFISMQKEPSPIDHLEMFRGKLGESEKTLLEALHALLSLQRTLYNLYTYASLRHSEDLGEPRHQERYEKIGALLHVFSQKTAWVEPEILAIPEKTIEKILTSPLLAQYTLFLRRIFRKKAHILESTHEELLALSGRTLHTPQKIFSAFNNADLQFPSIANEQGELFPLTHATYGKYLKEDDRTLRKNAFLTLHQSFKAYENTIAECFHGEVQAMLFQKKARHFNSCMEASLFYNEVNPEVYKSLIRAARKHLPSLHNYYAKRKEWLGLADLHLYDLSFPIVKEQPKPIKFEEAARLVIDSVAPLGADYQEVLRKGLLEQRWVDKYENMRKRSGAFSSGSYDSMPYILMNYNGTLSDVKTLAHEAGHSMHSYFSHKHQPYQYSDYSIFVAEVASTFNEELLIDHLMQMTSDPEVKAYLIAQRIDDIRNTFFRQAMFAEFELTIYELAEKEVPLTASLLKKIYHDLLRDYFGPAVTLDEEANSEWSRIPHFYSPFYVYQYATGISAAFALFEKMQKEGSSALLKYLEFLSSGSSDSPTHLLKKAGVDMELPYPVDALVKRFDSFVQELDLVFTEKTNKTKRLFKIPASSIPLESQDR